MVLKKKYIILRKSKKNSRTYVYYLSKINLMQYLMFIKKIITNYWNLIIEKSLGSKKKTKV